MRRRVLFAALAVAFAAGLRAAAPAWAPATYDLSALPAYEPREKVRGVVRVSGTPLEGLVGRWAAEFRARQKYVRLQAYLINTSQGMAGVTEGTAEIGLMGHRTWRNTLVAFERTHGYAPLEIKFASGSYDDPLGSTPGLVFFVHPDNPLAGLTLAQLDGVLGAARTGGWRGAKWTADAARGPEKNIRTWGQLGLTGEWADQPIRLHGTDLTLSNWADLIERVVFQGGRKWNEQLHEGPRADISWKSRGKTRDEIIVESVAHDRYALGFMFQRVVNSTGAAVKVLPLAAADTGPWIQPSARSFFDGSYPLRNGAYLYLNRAPGQPLPAREREFVRFILSREGQQVVAESRIFIPLDAAQARAELAKLE